MRLLLVLLVLAAGVAACGDEGEAGQGGEQPAGRTSSGSSAPADVATGLEVPWGIAFLPGGDALVSERTTGRILRLPAGGGEPSVAMEVPGVDVAAGEGGLLGLAVSPDYARDELVYAYYTTAEDNRIVRFRLGEEPQPIVTGLQRGGIHNGGRIAFGPDGKLYAGVGDTGVAELAQDPGSENGKILRMEPDGRPAAGNPDAASRVWTLGHRNVQGLAWDEEGRLWATEFGQDRFDEVNLIRPGRNYGWPEVEGEGDTAGGRFTNPVVTWSTSDSSPSGAAIAGGALYVAALRGERLWRVPLEGESAGAPEALLDGDYGRLRTVAAVPGGGLWVATSNRDGRGDPRDGDDRIIRVDAG